MLFVHKHIQTHTHILTHTLDRGILMFHVPPNRIYCIGRNIYFYVLTHLSSQFWVSKLHRHTRLLRQIISAKMIIIQQKSIFIFNETTNFEMTSKMMVEPNLCGIARGHWSFLFICFSLFLFILVFENMNLLDANLLVFQLQFNMYAIFISLWWHSFHGCLAMIDAIRFEFISFLLFLLYIQSALKTMRVYQNI